MKDSALPRGATAAFSGSYDLKIQLTYEGKTEPDWLNKVHPELAAIYREWATTNKPRINAVLEKAE